MSYWLFTTFSIPLKAKCLLALEEETRSFSFEELAQEVDRTSSLLEKQGIQRGDRVAFIPTISSSSIIYFLALLQIEATPCLLSSRTPKEMIPNLLCKAKASFFLDTNVFSIERLAYFPPSSSAILLFTSGSSGLPKLVHLTLSHFLHSALGSIPFLDLPGKWLLSVPLFHVSGLSILFRCLVSSSTILLSPSSNATHISFVPTQLIRLLQQEEPKFPFLRCLLLGGAPIAENLWLKAQKKNLPIYTTYGLTETASQVTLSSSKDSMHLGKALPYRELIISSEGEILVRGKTLFCGYEKQDSLDLPLTQDGWFATGDLGSLTPEGNLVYKGRKDNMFISGGENIYPEEIERVLGSFPGLLSCTVVPTSDLEFGQRPIAFIQMENSAILPKKAFQEYLSSQLPKFCCPIEYIPYPPTVNTSLKISRKELLKSLIKAN